MNLRVFCMFLSFFSREIWLKIYKIKTKTLNILCEYYLTNSSLSKKIFIKYGKKLF